MSVSSILSDIAPQFDGDAARDDFISLARNRVNYEYFCNNAEVAHAYMTAHMMTIRDLSQKTGGISTSGLTQLKEGDLSISMKGGSSADESELATTSYGKEFIDLQKSSGVGIGLTGVGEFLNPRII